MYINQHTDLIAPSVHFQGIKTNKHEQIFCYLRQQNRFAKILITAPWMDCRNRITSPLAPNIPCHAIYRQCLGTMYKSTKESFSWLAFFFKIWTEVYCMNCTPLYGSSLCIMIWGCSGCASDWDKPNGVCQNPEHWSVCKKLCLEDQHKTQHTGLDFCTKYVKLTFGQECTLRISNALQRDIADSNSSSCNMVHAYEKVRLHQSGRWNSRR
jgi:hypothetical protein